MKILVAAAKTGGHIYPAIAVAEEFIKNGHEAMLLGTNSLIEKNAIQTVPGIEHQVINMQGFRGNGVFNKIFVLIQLPINIFKLLRIIYKNKIDSVIVFGGFITIPVTIAAAIMSKPIFVHEQNAVLGSANKLSSKFAKRIFLGMPLHDKIINNTEIVGNPIRESFKASSHTDENNNIKIYITGGSQGAKYLNDNIPTALKNLKYPISIKHQCGKGKKEEVSKLYEGSSNIEIREFYNNPQELINWCDFVISRAGALSLSETVSMKKGLLMIPLPNAIDNHQLFNAEYIQKEGMGVIHEQKDGIQSLRDKIKLIIKEEKYLSWQKLTLKFNHQDATTIIFKSIFNQST
jgi:UDP-N-acetylglucosamine--N-acetylmuramyl-(pentapeptide) pyrophosphoryl-undecaprenol N-acetylglucosamine transferase